MTRSKRCPDCAREWKAHAGRKPWRILGGVNIAYDACQARVGEEIPSQRKNIDGVYAGADGFSFRSRKSGGRTFREAEARRLVTVDTRIRPGGFASVGPLMNVPMFYDAFRDQIRRSDVADTGVAREDLVRGQDAWVFPPAGDMNALAESSFPSTYDMLQQGAPFLNTVVLTYVKRIKNDNEN